ncbi:nitroreductase family protein [Thermodesulfobacteriota bacterium]
MDVKEAIEMRRSIRRFKPDKVSDEQIKEILEAARLAPSGSNIQPWRFVVIKTPEMREKLLSATPYRFVARAPVVFLCCADLRSLKIREQRKKELRDSGAFNGVEMGDLNSARGSLISSDISDKEARDLLSRGVYIAVENMALRATDLGLGSCWVGFFERNKVKEIFGLEDHIAPVVLLPVGYADQSPSQRPRLSLEEIVIKYI